jgi:hypothetical protein
LVKLHFLGLDRRVLVHGYAYPRTLKRLARVEKVLVNAGVGERFFAILLRHVVFLDAPAVDIQVCIYTGNSVWKGGVSDCGGAVSDCGGGVSDCPFPQYYIADTVLSTTLLTPSAM